MMGFLQMVINLAYALAFWYGWSLTEEVNSSGKSEYSVGVILLVFFTILSGVLGLGNL